MNLTVCAVCFAALAHGSLAAVLTVPTQDVVDNDPYKLPPGLLIGAGISATQAEGAWLEDGKSESVMDQLIQNSPRFGQTNEVSADHYHRYKEDLALAKELKFTTHRFSISWSRIFPTADKTKPNEKGVAYYKDYIQTIRDNGMEPFVTMYHFDHPYSLDKETGGWTNRTIVDKFVEYADFLFEQFGDVVKYWSPINEGNMYCIYVPREQGQGGIRSYDPHTFYECLHNTILAQTLVYRLYKKKYYATQKGQVGTSVLLWPATANTNDYKDSVAADIFNQLFSATSLDPVVHGDYPALSRYLIDKRSKALGLPKSRLPIFTPEEKALLVDVTDGPATDFVALNLYSGYKVEYISNASDRGDNAMAQIMLQPVLDDMEHVRVVDETFDSAQTMVAGLLWAWNRYHLPIVITENGYGDPERHGIHDYDTRAEYFRANIGGLVRTSNEFNIPVISYHAWSLLDVFEFKDGYEGVQYGVIHVDHKGKTLKRTLKDSSKFLIEMAESGRVPTSSTTVAPSSTVSPSSSTPKSSATSLITTSYFLLVACYLCLFTFSKAF